MDYLIALWDQYIVNVIDIALVAFLLFQVLMLIRGTRAVQIVVGIGILGVLTLLSQLLGFPTLNWLLQKFWIAGVVVLAVLFQQEMRQALARLGSKTAGRSVIHEEMEVINELVAAVKEASRRQMGMLVVTERDTGLRNYIESGTVINGEVTRELLLTLFQPPGVLHDGAVIIQGRRIAAAGCILPLSQDESLSKWLGTRHRAGVGVTETSDAWAVCVSEETGNIALAEGGKITTRVNPDELRQHLMNFYSSSRPVPTAEPHAL
jgi:diadenylate cyclase